MAVKGEVGGARQAERRKGGGEQTAEAQHPPLATVTMGQETAWKLVTKRRSPEAIRQQFPDVRITSDEALGWNVLRMVSVMA